MAIDYGSYAWPSSASSVTIASVGQNGVTAPTSSDQMGGVNPSGNLTPVNVDAAGNLIVDTSGGSSPVNPAGQYSQITNLTTAAQTFTAPTGAVGFILEAESGNSVNIRWAIGSVATTAAGMLMEPGRDSGFVPCAANVSVIAVSGSGQSIGIQWVLS